MNQTWGQSDKSLYLKWRRNKRWSKHILDVFREKDRKENEIPGPTEHVLYLSNELFLKYL